MSGPMDCADRLNVMITERALEPVRQMTEVADLTAVTVRTLCDGRRFDVTVRKLGADADHPAYGWELREVGEDGAPLGGGLSADGTAGDEPPLADPEDAYWSAVEAAESAS